MEETLLIYTDRLTNRLQYTVDFVFGTLFPISFELTDSREKIKSYSGSKLVYANEQIGELTFLKSHNLLFENDIRNFNIEKSEFQDVTVIFPTNAVNSSLLPFDPFAAVFFMISRYEEHLDHTPDFYGRFPASESLAYKCGFLKQPVVHYWCSMLRNALQEVYPSLKFGQTEYNFIPTFDIDNAFAYKHKGIIRTVLAGLRDLLTLKWQSFTKRISVISGIQKDPYDSFSIIRDIHHKSNLKPIIFWLIGDYGKYDKNIPYRNSQFRQLIKEQQKNSIIGIHPSYHASENHLVNVEKKRLEEITERQVFFCRMHYLRFSPSKTYHQLIESGITVDYSMGFADECGFRAGVAVPFNYYNFEEEKMTELKLYPFCIMDATLKYYKGFDNDSAWEEIKTMIAEVKKVNGSFCPVFHNESLGDDELWYGWKELYLKMIAEAQP